MSRIKEIVKKQFKKNDICNIKILKKYCVPPSIQLYSPNIEGKKFDQKFSARILVKILRANSYPIIFS